MKKTRNVSPTLGCHHRAPGVQHKELAARCCAPHFRGPESPKRWAPVWLVSLHSQATPSPQSMDRLSHPSPLPPTPRPGLTLTPTQLHLQE